MTSETKKFELHQLEYIKIDQIKQKRQDIMAQIAELPSYKQERIIKNLDQLIKIALITYSPSND